MPVDIEKKSNALVIGNGVSRLQFDLHELSKIFTTYGCNALYRDFTPDYLISMDIHMVQEIINARAHHKTKFYTQHVNDIDILAGMGEPINFVKTYVSTPDSGTAALELAAQNNHSVIYIIGFDYHQGKFNNVYAGTAHYHPHNYSTPIIQDDKWRTRLYNIAKQYVDIQFYRVTDEFETNKLNNLQNIAIENFMETVC